jgi:hypothetical protein
VLDTARADDYTGYSKHDALNARWLERLAGDSKLRRLAAIQLVMRCPVHVRPLLRVRKARNAKGLSLFARALLARYRMTGSDADAREAEALLDLLLADPSTAFGGQAWGYPYPWQDAGFFAPRNLPNRVVTSFVGEALLDGYETVGDARYLKAASEVAQFLLNAPRTLYEDDDRRCVSYVPDESVDWIVMDVSALVGAFAARLGAVQDDAAVAWSGMSSRNRPKRAPGSTQSLRRPATSRTTTTTPASSSTRSAVTVGLQGVGSSTTPIAAGSTSTSGGCSSRMGRHAS